VKQELAAYALARACAGMRAYSTVKDYTMRISEHCSEPSRSKTRDFSRNH